MGKLYFEHSWGDWTYLTDCRYNQILAEIDNFIEYNNRCHPDSAPFKRYYIRQWQDDNGDWVFDVGSYTEFFHWKEIK